MEFLHDWHPRDRAIAIGLTAYEDTTSPYGHPLSEVYDDDSDGHYEARPIFNYEDVAIAAWEKNNPKPDPGTRLQVVDTRKGEG